MLVLISTADAAPRAIVRELYDRERSIGSQGAAELTVTRAEGTDPRNLPWASEWDDAIPDQLVLKAHWLDGQSFNIGVFINELEVRTLRCDGKHIDTGDGNVWDMSYLRYGGSMFPDDENWLEFRAKTWPLRVFGNCLFPIDRYPQLENWKLYRKNLRFDRVTSDDSTKLASNVELVRISFRRIPAIEFKQVLAFDTFGRLEGKSTYRNQNVSFQNQFSDWITVGDNVFYPRSNLQMKSIADEGSYGINVSVESLEIDGVAIAGEIAQGTSAKSLYVVEVNGKTYREYNPKGTIVFEGGSITVQTHSSTTEIHISEDNQ
jgi:hypothetical protein